MKEQLLFKTIVGSTAYGTNVPGSDIDHKGIYMQSHYELLTNQYKPQIEVGKDECYYEVQRFLELLNTANPTVLEMLYMPDDVIIQSSAQFDLIRSQRQMFLTKKCRNSFGGYAVQQIQKARGLNKKMNWEKEKMVRKSPLDFCFIAKEGGSRPLVQHLKSLGIRQEYCGLVAIDHIRDGYALYHDREGDWEGEEPLGFKGIVLEDSNSIRLTSVPKGFDEPLGYIHYNKDGYTQHCNAYKSYETWLKERNTQRYVDIQGHGQKIDGKNMLHCRRLLDMAMEIATFGEIRVRRPNAKELIAIRRGEVDLETILSKAEEDIQRMDEMFASSSLPEDVDREKSILLLGNVRYMNSPSIIY